MKGVGSLLVFIALVTVAASSGALFPPGAWYAGLTKPPLNPPDWIFPPVWTALYLAMAVAAWQVWRAQRRVSGALWLWGGQLVLNALWSFLFFGIHQPGLALFDIALLFAGVIATAVAFHRVNRTAGWLLVPYAAWVAFASYLNFALWLPVAGSP